MSEAMERAISITDVETILEQIHDLESEIAEAAKKRDESIAYFEGRIANVKKNFEVDTHLACFEMEKLKGVLERYIRDNPPKRGKSIKFGGGTLSLSKLQPRFYFAGKEIKNDMPELVDFIRDHTPEHIKVEEKVDWAGLKKKLSIVEGSVCYAPTGEAMEGFTAEILPDKFEVKTS